MGWRIFLSEDLMRAALFSLVFAVAGPAHADVSASVATLGLSGARDVLENQTDRTPDEQFALAGLQFLATIERAYQARWTYGITAPNLPLPMFQGNLPTNPAPEAFTPETVRDITATFVDDLNAVAQTLAGIPDTADPAVSLSLPDLWFDANTNGARDTGEGLVDSVLPLLMRPFELRRLEDALSENPDLPDPRQATIRFDAADVHWLAAYAQVLQGAGEVILAFDPTSEIAKVMDARAAFTAQFGESPMNERVADIIATLRERDPDITDAEVAEFEARLQQSMRGGSPIGQFAEPVDLISIIIETLRHQPDQARIGKARDHFVAMVGHNRNFWSALAQETDNDAEWIPNPTQTATLGIEMPGDIGPAWLAVLTDLERALKGEVLLPFWRFAPSHGIDIDAYVRDPSPIAIVEWIQGSAALPFAAQGEVLSTESWAAFNRLVRGQTGLFVILLN